MDYGGNYNFWNHPVWNAFLSNPAYYYYCTAKAALLSHQSAMVHKSGSGAVVRHPHAPMATNSFADQRQPTLILNGTTPLENTQIKNENPAAYQASQRIISVTRGERSPLHRNGGSSLQITRSSQPQTTTVHEANLQSLLLLNGGGAVENNPKNGVVRCYQPSFRLTAVNNHDKNSSVRVNGNGIVNRVSPSSSNSSSPQNENSCFQNGSQSQPKNGVLRVYRAVQKNPTPSTSRSSMLPSSSTTTTTSKVIINGHSNGVLTPSSSEDADSRPQSGSEEQSGSEVVEKKKKKRNPVVIHDHITVISGEPTMFQCNVCMKKFKTKAHIKYHEFCQNGTKPFKCEECGQGFIAKSHYEYHLRTHTGERPYVCPKCGKGFNQRGKVTRHMRSHTGEKPFICSECGRGFANAQALRSHNLIHTGERPFACKYCNKRFTGMTNLKKHIITHTGERPYNCSHCPKSFGLKWTLDLHLRTHSSERPYACDQCTRAFSNSKDLRRHLVIHSGERPFKCWICGTAFRRKDNLDRHIKNTHNQPKEVAKQLANDAAAEYLAINQNEPVPPSKVNSAVISNVIRNTQLNAAAAASAASGSNAPPESSNTSPRKTRQRKVKEAEKPAVVVLQTENESQSNNEPITITTIDTAQLSPRENLEKNETTSASSYDSDTYILPDTDTTFARFAATTVVEQKINRESKTSDDVVTFSKLRNLVPSDCGIRLFQDYTSEDTQLIQQPETIDKADEFREEQIAYSNQEKRAHTLSIEEELMAIDSPVENNEIDDDDDGMEDEEEEEEMETNEVEDEDDSMEIVLSPISEEPENNVSDDSSVHEIVLEIVSLPQEEKVDTALVQQTVPDIEISPVIQEEEEINVEENESIKISLVAMNDEENEEEKNLEKITVSEIGPRTIFAEKESTPPEEHVENITTSQNESLIVEESICSKDNIETVSTEQQPLVIAEKKVEKKEVSFEEKISNVDTSSKESPAVAENKGSSPPEEHVEKVHNETFFVEEVETQTTNNDKGELVWGPYKKVLTARPRYINAETLGSRQENPNPTASTSYYNTELEDKDEPMEIVLSQIPDEAVKVKNVEDDFIEESELDTVSTSQEEKVDSVLVQEVVPEIETAPVIEEEEEEIGIVENESIKSPGAIHDEDENLETFSTSEATPFASVKEKESTLSDEPVENIATSQNESLIVEEKESTYSQDSSETVLTEQQPLVIVEDKELIDEEVAPIPEINDEEVAPISEINDEEVAPISEINDEEVDAGIQEGLMEIESEGEGKEREVNEDDDEPMEIPIPSIPEEQENDVAHDSIEESVLETVSTSQEEKVDSVLAQEVVPEIETAPIIEEEEETEVEENESIKISLVAMNDEENEEVKDLETVSEIGPRTILEEKESTLSDEPVENIATSQNESLIVEEKESTYSQDSSETVLTEQPALVIVEDKELIDEEVAPISEINDENVDAGIQEGLMEIESEGEGKEREANEDDDEPMEIPIPSIPEEQENDVAHDSIEESVLETVSTSQEEKVDSVLVPEVVPEIETAPIIEEEEETDVEENESIKISLVAMNDEVNEEVKDLETVSEIGPRTILEEKESTLSDEPVENIATSQNESLIIEEKESTYSQDSNETVLTEQQPLVIVEDKELIDEEVSPISEINDENDDVGIHEGLMEIECPVENDKKDDGYNGMKDEGEGKEREADDDEPMEIPIPSIPEEQESDVAHESFEDSELETVSKKVDSVPVEEIEREIEAVAVTEDEEKEKQINALGNEPTENAPLASVEEKEPAPIQEQRVGKQVKIAEYKPTKMEKENAHLASVDEKESTPRPHQRKHVGKQVKIAEYKPTKMEKENAPLASVEEKEPAPHQEKHVGKQIKVVEYEPTKMEQKNAPLASVEEKEPTPLQEENIYDSDHESLVIDEETVPINETEDNAIVEKKEETPFEESIENVSTSCNQSPEIAIQHVDEVHNETNFAEQVQTPTINAGEVQQQHQQYFGQYNYTIGSGANAYQSRYYYPSQLGIEHPYQPSVGNGNGNGNGKLNCVYASCTARAERNTDPNGPPIKVRVLSAEAYGVQEQPLQNENGGQRAASEQQGSQRIFYIATEPNQVVDYSPTSSQARYSLSLAPPSIIHPEVNGASPQITRHQYIGNQNAPQVPSTSSTQYQMPYEISHTQGYTHARATSNHPAATQVIERVQEVRQNLLPPRMRYINGWLYCNPKNPIDYSQVKQQPQSRAYPDQQGYPNQRNMNSPLDELAAEASRRVETYQQQHSEATISVAAAIAAVGEEARMKREKEQERRRMKVVAMAAINEMVKRNDEREKRENAENGLKSAGTKKIYY